MGAGGLCRSNNLYSENNGVRRAVCLCHIAHKGVTYLTVRVQHTTSLIHPLFACEGCSKGVLSIGSIKGPL